MLGTKKQRLKCRYRAALLASFLLAAPGWALDTATEFDSTLEAIRALEADQARRLASIEELEDRASAMAGRTAEFRSTVRGLEEAVAEVERQILDVQFQASKLRNALRAMQERAQSLIRMRWTQDRHLRSIMRNESVGNTGPETEELTLDRHRIALDRRVLEAQETLLGEMQRAQLALIMAEDALEGLRVTRVERRRLAQENLRALQREERVLTATLEAIREQVTNGQQEMERLQHNARMLEETLAKMQRIEIPVLEPFAARRGLLVPPVPTGRLHRFGETRGTWGGPARWQGEVFTITEELEVRSVHAGEVVFADWMRGYGFLVIVDHGDGFLTLYGHNQELLARTGNRVETGQVIALVAPETPTPSPGLYFELRQDARVLNPEAWWRSNAH